MPRILILDKENAGFSKISSKTKGYTKKNNAFLYLLRSKRFRLVSEQSKTKERDFWFLAVRKMEREPLFARSTWKQPPPQAPRFSQGRGERLVMNRKGLWEGSPVVSFRPSFARTFSPRERERRPGARQERKRLRHRLSHLLQAQEDPRSTPSNWLLSSQLGNESFRSFIRPINSQRHH